MSNNKKTIESFYSEEKREFNAKYLWWHYTFEKLAIIIAGYMLPYNISANFISSISLIFGLLGCCLIAINPESFFLLGIILIVIWQILDDVDGHIARTKESTKLGKYLDDSGANIMYAFFYASLGLVFLSTEDYGNMVFGQLLIGQSSANTLFIILGLLSSIFLSLQAILSFHHKILSEPINRKDNEKEREEKNQNLVNIFMSSYKYFVSNVLEFPGFLVPLVLFSYTIGYLSVLLLLLTLFNLANLIIKYFSITRNLS